MIKYGLFDVVARNFGSKAISEVRKGARLMWQAIRSCFGAGYWRGDKPWIGTDAWKG